MFDNDYPDEKHQVRFFENLVTRLEGKPGVDHVALASHLPGLGGSISRFAVEGSAYASDQDHPRARIVAVTPKTFDLFGVGMLEGRDFRFSDDMGSPRVAVVNQSFAEKFFPGRDPLGKRFRLRPTDNKRAWLTIVGVVPDMMTTGWLEEESTEGFYVPLTQSPSGYINVAIRTQGDPLALASMVGEEVMAIDPNLLIFSVNTLSGAITQRTWYVDVFGTLFVIFGLAALLLSEIGLYGVMAFSISRRTHEFGLRMTLGAQAADVMKLILKQGLTQLALGLFLGIGLRLGLSRAVEGIFYGVNAWDPVAYTSVAAAMVATSVLACLVPARRATRVDPAVALRYR